MKLLIATNNAHKAREIREILGDSFTELLTMREAGVELEVEEDGTTFTAALCRGTAQAEKALAEMGSFDVIRILEI